MTEKKKTTDKQCYFIAPQSQGTAAVSVFARADAGSTVTSGHPGTRRVFIPL